MGLAPGTKLGPFEILAPLGAGGMGEVYRARDARLDREVAIKLLPDGTAAHPEALERFRREARAASALNHPHICTVHDFGEHEGKPFLVMERLRGVTLKEAIGGRPMPVERVLKLGAQVADALEAAHEAGIVHRDVKTANVFVTERDEAKLLDFGLAKVALRSTEPASSALVTADAEAQLTSPGSTLGTVSYMSPEQARGEELDERSDLFSLGIVLYEMATGRLPFAGRTSAEIFDGILNRAPASPVGFNSALPEELGRIILKALEKEKELRTQHASDLEADLRRLLRDSTAGKARAMASGPVPAALPRRSPVAAVGAAVAALAVAGVWLTWGGGARRAAVPTESGTRSARRIAVLPFENAGAAEGGYFADGMTEEVRSKLSGLSELSVIASTSSDQYRATTKPAEQIAQELGVRYLLLAKVRWQKSGSASRIRVTPELVEVGGGETPTTRWQEAFDADLSDVFRVQSEIATKVARSLDVVLSGKERGRLEARPTSNLAAWDSYLKGMEFPFRGGALKSAVAQFERAVALDPGFALAWAHLSMCQSFLYAVSDPSPQEAEAARIAAERAAQLAPNLPQSSMALAFYYADVTGDRARARAVFARALKAAPDDVHLLLGAASLAESWEGCLELYRRIEYLDPRSPFAQQGLAYSLLFLRRGNEAREASDRGLALAPGSIDLVHIKVMTFLQEGSLAGARQVVGAAATKIDPTYLATNLGTYHDLDWVLDDSQRDLLLRMTPNAFEGDRAAWGLVLAQASSRRADLAKVRGYAEEARKSLTEKLAKNPDSGSHRALLGLSLAFLERKEEAVREGERAVAQKPSSEDLEEGPYNKHQLVRIYILAGDHEKALDLLETLLKAPYFLTPGWLRVDPNFDPLRGNARFEKLARGG